MTLRAFVSPFGDRAASDGDALVFAEAVREVSERSSPVILWVSRSATVDLPGLPIPAHVSLAFAPGAVLTLPPSGRIEHLGRLDAGVERRFELADGARVLLRGPLDEIHASWWGTGPLAVTHALDALWDRYENDREPAPIRLSGPYPLQRPVRVEPPVATVAAVTRPGRDPVVDVVLRGGHYGARGPMTFTVDDVENVGGMPALLAVDGQVTLTLENVGFDTTRSSGRRGAGAALILAGDHDRSHIEGCTFRVGDAKGIDVTVLGLRWRDTYVDSARGLAEGIGLGAFFLLLAAQAGAGRAASRVSVSRCDFEGVPVDKRDVAIPIAVDATAPTMLEVSDCQFRGSYGCGILFMGADLMVTHCAFDNLASPAFSDPSRSADIHLGLREPTTVTGAAPKAHLTATHCVSTSPCFLVGRQGPTTTGSGGALLTNVLHQPTVIIANARNCSIRWIGPYDSQSLVLQGCEFGAEVRQEEGSNNHVVVDIGTRFLRPAAFWSVHSLAVEPVVSLYDPNWPERP